jgi:hypothetical protein
MPDLTSAASDVRGLPDQALQQELTNPTGTIPSYLVLAEAQRRQLMRQASDKQQSQQSGSVYDDVVKNMMARQPPAGLPPPPAGMTPPATGQGGPPSPTPGSTPPGNFQTPAKMADGGVYEDYDPTDEESSVLDQIMRHESGGDYTAHNPKSTASGAYQFVNGTWKTAAKNTGIGTEYATAAEAPPEVQDKNALWLLRHYGPNSTSSWGGSEGPKGGYPDPYKKKSATSGLGFLSDPNMTFSDAPENATWPPTGSGAEPQVAGAPTPELDPAAALPAPAQPSAPAAPEQLAATEPMQTGLLISQPTPHTQPVDRLIAQLDRQIADERQGMGNAPDRYSAENIQKTAAVVLPALYGVPANYLQTLDQVASMRKATIQQLQADALQRYQHPDMGSFLANIARGMNHSGSVNLPAMFAEGVGLATSQRNADRERALSDFDALSKESETIDNNIDLLRQHMGGSISTFLEHQASQDALAQQRSLSRIDKWEKDREGLIKYQNPNKVSQTDLASGAVVSQMLQNAGLPAPMNSDGTSRIPTIQDLPANLQTEAQWRIKVNKDGYTPKNVDALLEDPHAPADLKSIAQGIKARQATDAAAKTTATTGARIKATAEAKAALPASALQLTTQGQKDLDSLNTLTSQYTDLIEKLKPYKDNNNPLTLMGPMAKYKLGIASPEGELGNNISSLSLGTLQAMQPFASKSRNQTYFQQIKEHLPKLDLPFSDSPQQIYKKMLNVQQNLLRMENGHLRWEVKGVGTNPPDPVLDQNRFSRYLQVAEGDSDKATQLARADHWQVGRAVQDPNGKTHYFPTEAQAKAFEDAISGNQ